MGRALTREVAGSGRRRGLKDGQSCKQSGRRGGRDIHRRRRVMSNKGFRNFKLSEFLKRDNEQVFRWNKDSINSLDPGTQ